MNDVYLCTISFREHTCCIWNLGAHIKSDPQILDPTLLGRLGDRGLFTKILSHGGGNKGRCFS
jgi:hypothetical protein